MDANQIADLFPLLDNIIHKGDEHPAVIGQRHHFFHRIHMQIDIDPGMLLKQP